MPEQLTPPIHTKNPVYVGVWNVVKKYPEWWGKEAVALYDKFRFSKLTGEEEKVADKTHRILKKHEKAIGWGITGVQAAILAGVVALGYRRMRRGSGIGVMEHSTERIVPVESAIPHPVTPEPEPGIIRLPRSGLERYNGAFWDSTISALAKMDELAVRELLVDGDDDRGILQNTVLTPHRLPPFFIRNLAAKVWALPANDARRTCMAAMIANGSELWKQFAQTMESDPVATVQDNDLRWLELEKFISGDGYHWVGDVYAKLLKEWSNFAVTEILDSFADKTGFSLRGWLKLSRYWPAPTDSGSEMTGWLRELGSLIPNL